MTKIIQLRDVIGSRGEKIADNCLTDYKHFTFSLFQVGFFNEKWPAIDAYVELLDVAGLKPFFFVQVKSTAGKIGQKDSGLKISTKKHDIERLLQIPCPTYLLGVHEPSQRVFCKSIHSGMAAKAITRIEWKHELHAQNLRNLYDEVLAFWQQAQRKPTTSVFS